MIEEFDNTTFDLERICIKGEMIQCKLSVPEQDLITTSLPEDYVKTILAKNIAEKLLESKLINFTNQITYLIEFQCFYHCFYVFYHFNFASANQKSYVIEITTSCNVNQHYLISDKLFTIIIK